MRSRRGGSRQADNDGGGGGGGGEKVEGKGEIDRTHIHTRACMRRASRISVHIKADNMSKNNNKTINYFCYWWLFPVSCGSLC